MKIKAIGLAMAVAMLAALTALPASANSGGDDAGVFQGTATVSKAGTCSNNGTVTGQSGGGIGLPVLGGYKDAIYSIVSADGVLSVVRGTGSLTLCGYLTGPLDDTVGQQEEVGASCVATKGYGGSGEATFGGTVVYIQNLGWKATVGGTFLVTGDSSTGSKLKKADGIVAAVQALSEGAVIGCLNKVTQVVLDGAKSGTQDFTVAAAYTILGGQGGLGNKKTKD